MNKLALKLGAGTVSAAVMLSMFAANTFASTDITISENGVGSNNTVRVRQTCTTEVTQTNNTNVNFNVHASSNTGHNTIENVTGDGDNTNDTGDATTTVGLVVMGGDNSATVPDCCCGSDENDLTVDVSGNGVGSNNLVKSKKKNKLVIEQKSKSKVKAKVKAKSNTGNNEITNATGGGNENSTGDATTEVAGSVTGGGNSL